MNPWMISIPLSYLLGSIPFGYVLVRVFRHQDVRATGSGNIGATNVARMGGKGLGIATLVLDCLKGAVAVLLAYWLAVRVLAPSLPGVDGFFLGRGRAFEVGCAAAVFAILGHVFPVWLGFRGGKGVATALGVFMVLCWPAVLCAVAAFVLVFALTKYVSLASVVAALVMAVSAMFFVRGYTGWMLAAFLGIPALVIAKHHANLRRLMAGTESRFKSSASEKVGA